MVFVEVDVGVVVAVAVVVAVVVAVAVAVVVGVVLSMRAMIDAELCYCIHRGGTDPSKIPHWDDLTDQQRETIRHCIEIALSRTGK